MVAVAETAAAVDPKSKAIKKKKDTKPKRAKLTFLTTDQFYLFSGGWASNWKQAPFTMDGVKYLTTEQAMMAYKAQVFGDEDKRAAIMAATEPKLQKRLGRQVHNFDAKAWDKVAFDLVTKANLHKFQQNPDLKESLLDTGDRTIVEASARDRKWGIGLAVTDPRAQDPTKWRGENLLGKALMKVREQLHAEAAENKKQVKCTCNPRTIAGGLGHAFWCAKVMDGFAQDHKRRRKANCTGCRLPAGTPPDGKASYDLCDDCQKRWKGLSCVDCNFFVAVRDKDGLCAKCAEDRSVQRKQA